MLSSNWMLIFNNNDNLLQIKWTYGLKIYLHIREDDHWQDHDKGHSPDRCAHHLGHARVSPFGATDRMDHSQITIHGHDREAEDGRELVHGVRSHHHTTEERSKGPVRENVLSGEEGQSDDVELIGHGQVQDVDVGDGLHLGVAQHHVNGQCVAGQTHQEDSEVDNSGHRGAAALEGDTLRGHVGGDVQETRGGKEKGGASGCRGVGRREWIPVRVRRVHRVQSTCRCDSPNSENILYWSYFRAKKEVKQLRQWSATFCFSYVKKRFSLKYN